MDGRSKRQPQPPSPQAASAPPFFVPPATFFFGVVEAGAAVPVLAGAAAAVVVAGAVVAGAAAAAFAAGAAGADAVSAEVFDSVAVVSAVFSVLAPPQAPFAAQLALAPFPSLAGTSVAGELAWLPAHAVSTAPEPMTANAAANLLIFMVMFSLYFSCSVDRRRIDE